MNASLLFQEKVSSLLGLVAHNASMNGEPGLQKPAPLRFTFVVSVGCFLLPLS